MSDDMTRRLINAVIVGMLLSGCIGLFPAKRYVDSGEFAGRGFLFPGIIPSPPRRRIHRYSNTGPRVAPSNEELKRMAAEQERLRTRAWTRPRPAEIDAGRMLGECLVAWGFVGLVVAISNLRGRGQRDPHTAA